MGDALYRLDAIAFAMMTASASAWSSERCTSKRQKRQKGHKGLDHIVGFEWREVRAGIKLKVALGFLKLYTLPRQSQFLGTAELKSVPAAQTGLNPDLPQSRSTWMKIPNNSDHAIRTCVNTAVPNCQMQ